MLCGHFMSANPTSMFALAACCRGSPLSAAVTLSYFQRSRAANWGPLEVLSQDYVLCGHFMSAESDFYEGVRARLIDKDDKPHWNHNSIEEVRGRGGGGCQHRGCMVACMQATCTTACVCVGGGGSVGESSLSLVCVCVCVFADGGCAGTTRSSG